MNVAKDDASSSARERGVTARVFGGWSDTAARQRLQRLFAEDPDDAQDSDDGEEHQEGDEGAPEHPGQPAGRRSVRRQRQLVNDGDEDRRRQRSGR